MTHSIHRAIRIAGLLLLAAACTACGGGGGGSGGDPPPPPALSITTTTLPAGDIGAAYSQTIAATGGTGARTFSVSAGALPAGLALAAASGVISGTPTGTAGTVNFTVSVADSGTPQQTDTQALSITINAVAVRNDSIATATPLSNGSFAASISPSGEPSSVFNPDEDYYAITTTAASTVTLDINAQVNGSPIDTVIEIVGANGTRLNTCIPPAFTSPCVHDDEDPGVDLDSLLEIRVAGPTTFFLHVVEWRGDARPDLLYTLNVSGIN